jgi:hypothetical protein
MAAAAFIEAARHEGVGVTAADRMRGLSPQGTPAGPDADDAGPAPAMTAGHTPGQAVGGTTGSDWDPAFDATGSASSDDSGGSDSDEDEDDEDAEAVEDVLRSLGGSGAGMDVAAGLAALQRVPGNGVCGECGASRPKWASVNLGVLFCLRCSGLHRSLGTHLTQVRSLTLDTWQPAWIARCLRVGNVRAAKYWEAKRIPEGMKPQPSSSMDDVKRFLVLKYDKRTWAAPGPSPDERLDSAAAAGANGSTRRTKREKPAAVVSPPAAAVAHAAASAVSAPRGTSGAAASRSSAPVTPSHGAVTTPTAASSAVSAAAAAPSAAATSAWPTGSAYESQALTFAGMDAAFDAFDFGDSTTAAPSFAAAPSPAHAAHTAVPHAAAGVVVGAPVAPPRRVDKPAIVSPAASTPHAHAAALHNPEEPVAAASASTFVAEEFDPFGTAAGGDAATSGAASWPAFSESVSFTDGFASVADGATARCVCVFVPAYVCAWCHVRARACVVSHSGVVVLDTHDLLLCLQHSPC